LISPGASWPRSPVVNRESLWIPQAARIWHSRRCWNGERAELAAIVTGMDIYGRNPSSEAGKYFRANIWSWRPIHALIEQECADLLDAELLERLGYNNGAGPKDQETCTAMANRFERWLEHHVGGHALDSELQITPEGRFVSEDERADNPELETVSPYGVEDEHLKEWVEFLRHCGGFEVW